MGGYDEIFICEGIMGVIKVYFILFSLAAQPCIYVADYT